MAKRARKTPESRRRGHSTARGAVREWLGARLSPLALEGEDDGEPHPPDLVLWLDGLDDLIVGQRFVDPGEARGAVASVLSAALSSPLAGPPRRPDRVRVPDPGLVAEVRRVLPDVPIHVAPTPELEQVAEMLSEAMHQRGEPLGYLEGGISPDVAGGLFAAAERLVRAAPWEFVSDDQLLRVDAPALGLDGACVCVIGQLGQQRGLLVFRSEEAWARFLDHAEEPHEPLDLGGELLSLTFWRGADLPQELRREVAVHEWPVADANAYPMLARQDRQGGFLVPTERDLRIAAACAGALVPFCARHEGEFAEEDLEPASERLLLEDGLEVHVTAPYDAFDLFELGADEPADAAQPTDAPRPSVGRNAPCWCGSGKKYKKCHLSADEAGRGEAGAHLAAHDLDFRLARKISRWAHERFGEEWLSFERDFYDALEVEQLVGPWAVYGYPVQGRTAADWYEEERGKNLSAPEREWLASQRASWLSVWEVLEVKAGEGLKLRDLLSDEERLVHEASASEVLRVREALLARVVDHGAESLLCGTHPQPLPPGEVAEVVRKAKGRLRRKSAAPVERLRDGAFARYLIRRWEEAAFDHTSRPVSVPSLQNTDGDALLLTTDHFELDPADEQEVARRLAGLEGASPEAAGPEVEPDPAVTVFLGPLGEGYRGNRTILGHATLCAGVLRVDTNSPERADALRHRVETACGPLIRHRAREHADPVSEASLAAASESPPEPPSPEVAQRLREFKRQHYAGWPDEPLPALGGKTAREAVRRAEGRREVDALLKQMEHMESQLSEAEAFDFGELRRELGLD